MKTIIAGSRPPLGREGFTIEDVCDAMEKVDWKVTEVVCGMARGVDLIGKRWAEYNEIPVAKFPADWDKYDKRAGYIRNVEMAEYADALVALWDGHSRGTANMIQEAKKRNLKILVITRKL